MVVFRCGLLGSEVPSLCFASNATCTVSPGLDREVCTNCDAGYTKDYALGHFDTVSRD